MKMCDFIGTAKKLLGVNMGLKEGEKLLVLYDETTLKIGESLFIAGEALGAETLSVRMSILPGNGVEPPSIVSEAMTKADVVVAPLGMSITSCNDGVGTICKRPIPLPQPSTERTCSASNGDHRLASR